MVVDNKGNLSYVRVLKEDLLILRITPVEGQVPDFKAGQFLTVGQHIPREGKVIRRAYSIASPPERKKYFELLDTLGKKTSTGKAYDRTLQYEGRG